MKLTRTQGRTLLALVWLLAIVACSVSSPRERELHRWWAGFGMVVKHDSFPGDCKLCHVGANWNEVVDSFAFDPVAGDWIVGTREGTIERWVGDQQAEDKIVGLGTNPTATSNRVAGLHYFPVSTTPADVSYGLGCEGNEGWTPTDSSFGAPVAGSTGFRFGLFSANPGDLVVLLLDFQNVTIGGVPLPADLTGLGAPGCFVRTGNLFSQFLVTGGSGAGGGQATIPLALPANMTGLSFYRQWAELQATPTNGLGIVVSNARQLTVL